MGNLNEELSKKIISMSGLSHFYDKINDRFIPYYKELVNDAEEGSLAIITSSEEPKSINDYFEFNLDSIALTGFNLPAEVDDSRLSPLVNKSLYFLSTGYTSFDQIGNAPKGFVLSIFNDDGNAGVGAIIPEDGRVVYLYVNADPDILNDINITTNGVQPQAINELNQYISEVGDLKFYGLIPGDFDGENDWFTDIEMTQEESDSINYLLLNSSMSTDLYIRRNNTWQNITGDLDWLKNPNNIVNGIDSNQIKFEMNPNFKDFVEAQGIKYNIEGVDPDTVAGMINYNAYISAAALADARVVERELNNHKNNLITKLTYSELVSLRNSSRLIPGLKYRITDYACSGIGQNMSVMNHSFDIIVEALAKNKLSENAKAAQRSNDIGPLINSRLFEYTDINSWKALDVVSDMPQPLLNIAAVSTDGKVAYDRTKHSGLNPGNVIKVTFTGFVNDYNNTSAQKPIVGLGVVLANQDDTEILAYDYGYDQEAYYITMPDNVTSNTSYYIKFYADGSNTDAINGICGTKAEVYSGTPYFKNNDLSKWDLKYSLDRDGFNWPSLDTNVFKGVIYYMKDDFNNEAPYDFKNILFPVTINGSSNYYYTFSYVNNGSVYDATVVTDKCFENKIKGTYNIDGTQSLNKIVFVNEDFGSDKNCSFNSFDGYCNNMVFGHACCSNTFGCYCANNSFGRECSFNKFGDYFGLNNGGNSFGNYCQSNTFGVNCDKNTFGNYILRTTFGNKCTSCKFTNATSNGSVLEACKCITVGDECNNLNLYNTEGPSYSSGKFLQNIEVNSGLTGNVKISGLNKGYKQVVAKDSNGQISIYIDGESSIALGSWMVMQDGELTLDTSIFGPMFHMDGDDRFSLSIGNGLYSQNDTLKLDTASDTQLGGIKLGTWANVWTNGTECPIRNDDTRGAYAELRIGSGLTANRGDEGGDGKLSVSAGTGLTFDDGKLSVAIGSGLTVDKNDVKNGLFVSIGTGMCFGNDGKLTISAGTGLYFGLDGKIALGAATTTQLGGIKAGNTLTIYNGTLNVSPSYGKITEINPRNPQYEQPGLKINFDRHYIIANPAVYSSSYIYLDAMELNNYSSNGLYSECKIYWQGGQGLDLKIGTTGLVGFLQNQFGFSESAAQAAATDMVNNNIRIPQAITKSNTAGPIEITIRTYGQAAKSAASYKPYYNEYNGYITGTGLACKHIITWQKV